MTTQGLAAMRVAATGPRRRVEAGDGGGAPDPSRALVLGSMCSGYGGLDMAIAAVLPVRLAWVADPDPGASAVLAHHHPDVPNLGDITTVDWATVEPVNVLTAGFPCQDLSYAGRGAGIREGTRSGLWHTIADAVRVLRPRLLFLENVRAIVSRRPGLDVVLGDLARLGFDAEWTCVRASDVGAPHPRERWFLLAWPSDSEGPRLQGPWLPGRVAGGGGAAADTDGLGHDGAAGEQGADRRSFPAPSAPTDTARYGRDEGRAEPAGIIRRPDAALCGLSPAADAASLCHEDEPRDHHPRLLLAESGPGRRDRTGHHAAGAGRAGGRPGLVEWGPYSPAIHRWERTLGRPAPHPVGPTAKGGEGLSPVFVEWLMGLPAGHVTAVPSLTRNQQLKLLGNGVVWQQGAAAYAELLDRLEVAS